MTTISNDGRKQWTSYQRRLCPISSILATSWSTQIGETFEIQRDVCGLCHMCMGAGCVCNHVHLDTIIHVCGQNHTLAYKSKWWCYILSLDNYHSGGLSISRSWGNQDLTTTGCIRIVLKRESETELSQSLMNWSVTNRY